MNYRKRKGSIESFHWVSVCVKSFAKEASYSTDVSFIQDVSRMTYQNDRDINSGCNGENEGNNNRTVLKSYIYIYNKNKKIPLCIRFYQI